MMRFFSPIGSGWKKIDVKQKDKSHVGPQRKKKHVVDLIKMVKKIMGPQRGQKSKKGKEPLHYTIFTPLVNKSSGSTKRSKNKRGQKTCSFITQTFL
jgi:hypothetical protein